MQKNKKFYLISKIEAAKKLIQEKKVKKNQINKIDKKSCSIFYENLFKTIKKDDFII